MKPILITGLACIAALSACTRYTPPEASGLVAVRAYPTDADVCQVIGENDLTAEYLDHTAILVGCPSHEMGAITNRLAEGGTKVDQVGDWVLISIPQ